MKLTQSWKILSISVFISVVFSSAISFQIAKDTLNKEKQFKVVDIQLLSKALMENLEKTIKEEGTELNPEFVKVIAQNEAKKMFQVIARSSGKNEIVIPKSSVIYVPDRYELTEEIAESMGLEGVVVKSLQKQIDEIDSKESD
ncbi:hypothetical protein [Thalassotalea piscium]|uniref:Uncharacterized protein n=1 Tax=Thalassotalea piscium TaxID=1230533 RepID=A0A7X0NGV1_9GAMM|nr:hypothetical protein [Thalassotalea piscium]MBB6543066.1 hypothetical protein [Thalassotalea piscium]